MRSALLAVAFAAASFASQAQANYTITLGNVTLSQATGGVTFGGTAAIPTASSGATTFDFAVAGNPQNSFGNFAQNFNVINVGEPTTDGNGTGSFTVSQNITLTGSFGTETGVLSGTFNIQGAQSTLTNRVFTVTSGSGYSVAIAGYAQPTPPASNTGTTSGTLGNISISVTPVPEPASVAMLGLGLGGLGLVAARRRRLAPLV